MRIEELKTPCYVIDEKQLKKNLSILQKVEKDTGCKILLAQKAFSCFYEYPLIGQYISGTTASGLYEARLGYEEMGKENHVFAPAYKEKDMKELVQICDHVIFNSFAQYVRHRKKVAARNAVSDTSHRVSIGLRINPEYSTQEGHAIYDPCAPGSRLGMTREAFEKGLAGLGMRRQEDGSYELPEDVEGLHFHTLCEQDADDLECTFYAFEEQFASYLKQVRWLNLGGGHHITRPGYQIERLKKLIGYIRETYGLAVYLEPGEAWALNAGYLVTTVLDTLRNGDTSLAILDMSAACHTPDVIEMPYRPPLLDAGDPGEKPCTVRLGGPTCLAGDVMGDYSFNTPLAPGQRLVFGDMAIYTTCKNNTFNGMPLPDIWLLRQDGSLARLAHFGYQDFRCRLGGRGDGALDTTSVQI